MTSVVAVVVSDICGHLMDVITPTKINLYQGNLRKRLGKACKPLQPLSFGQIL